MRAIDADALIADCQLAQKQADRHGIEYANAFYSGGGEVSTEWWCVEDMIENAPTIEPQRKKGKWIDTTQGDHYKCSCCGTRAAFWFNEENSSGWEKDMSEWLSDFCPNCGADMREPEDIPMEYFESGGR